MSDRNLLPPGLLWVNVVPEYSSLLWDAVNPAPPTGENLFASRFALQPSSGRVFEVWVVGKNGAVEGSDSDDDAVERAPDGHGSFFCLPIGTGERIQQVRDGDKLQPAKVRLTLGGDVAHLYRLRSGPSLGYRPGASLHSDLLPVIASWHKEFERLTKGTNANDSMKGIEAKPVAIDPEDQRASDKICEMFLEHAASGTKEFLKGFGEPKLLSTYAEQDDFRSEYFLSIRLDPLGSLHPKNPQLCPFMMDVYTAAKGAVTGFFSGLSWYLTKCTSSELDVDAITGSTAFRDLLLIISRLLKSGWISNRGGRLLSWVIEGLHLETTDRVDIHILGLLPAEARVRKRPHKSRPKAFPETILFQVITELAECLEEGFEITDPYGQNPSLEDHKASWDPFIHMIQVFNEREDLKKFLYEGYHTPAAACAFYGEVDLLRHWHANIEDTHIDLCAVEGSSNPIDKSPSVAAFEGDQVEAFRTLLELGVKPSARSKYHHSQHGVSAPGLRGPTLFYALMSAHQRSYSFEEGAMDAKEKMLIMAAEAGPSALLDLKVEDQLDAGSLVDDYGGDRAVLFRMHSMLELAAFNLDKTTLEALLKAAGDRAAEAFTCKYTDDTVPELNGAVAVREPTLARLLRQTGHEGVAILLKDHAHALLPKDVEYSEKAQLSITKALAKYAFYYVEGVCEDDPGVNEAAEGEWRNIEVILSILPFVKSFDEAEQNILTTALEITMPKKDFWLQSGKRTGDKRFERLREQALLKVVEAFHNKGFDLSMCWTRERGIGKPHLYHHCIPCGYKKMARWALDNVVSRDPVLDSVQAQCTETPVFPASTGMKPKLLFKDVSTLAFTLMYKQEELALELIRKRGAGALLLLPPEPEKPTSPFSDVASIQLTYAGELRPIVHPFVTIPCLAEHEGDETACLRVLKVMIEEGSDREVVKKRLLDESLHEACFDVGGPLYGYLNQNLVNCIHYLLSPAEAGGAGLDRDMVARGLNTAYLWMHGNYRAMLAQKAVRESRWGIAFECVKNGARVTLATNDCPSVYDLTKTHCPHRGLRLAIDAAYKKEKEEEKATKEAAAPAKATPASTTNAFEDPSTRVLSEREVKEKARKKAAKKKAKAKKKAAAKAANAGAGVAKDAVDSDGDSTDDSGVDEEEMAMTEEERMLARAPTFDLEKEKAASKARAEAEAKAPKK
jgi:hypothetical protein